jgi:hypothetical protein
METWRVFEASATRSWSPPLEATVASATGDFAADEATEDCGGADGPAGLAQAANADTTIKTSKGFQIRRMRPPQVDFPEKSRQRYLFALGAVRTIGMSGCHRRSLSA